MSRDGIIEMNIRKNNGNINAMSVLENVNKSHYMRPSKMKIKKTKQKAKRDLMKQVAAIFGNNMNGTISTNSPNSPEMAAIILTRWAKRRLVHIEAKKREITSRNIKNKLFDGVPRSKDEAEMNNKLTFDNTHGSENPIIKFD